MYIRISVPERFQFRIMPTIQNLLFHNTKELHYIGGAEILPPPLDAEKESACIEQLQTEEGQTAKQKLIEHNLRLVVYIAKKFDNTGVGVEDLISIGTIGLIKSVNTYNPTKNIKLATYASRCIENEILMYLRRTSKMKMEVSIDEPLNVDWDGNELLLSDSLGTDDDLIYRDMELEGEKELLKKAVGTQDHRTALWIERQGRTGNDTKGSCGSYGNIPVLYFPLGEKDHEAAEKRN